MPKQAAIRKALKSDMPQVMELIRELAIYEKAEEEVAITADTLIKDGFSDHPLFNCFVATDENNVVLGFALYYYKYSTWKGKALYLEDLLVSEKQRGQGIGKQLFDTLVAEAKQQNCGRMEWQVLDWNHPAINFYEKYQAKMEDDWLNARLFPADFDRILADGSI